MNLIGALLLFVGLSLSSLYLFPSGGPQLADFVLIGFAGVMLLMSLGDKHLKVSPFAMCWGLMVLWVVMVCLSWTLVMETTEFFRPAQFFLFNFLIGMGLLRFLSVYGERAIGLIRNSISIALVIAGGHVLVQLALGINRTTGSFNNPNQLAYFSLCGVVVLLMLDDFHPKMRPLALAGLASGVLGILSASSLAAMGGGAMVGIGWAIANAKQVKYFARLLLLVPLLLGGVVLANISTEGQVLRNLEARMDRAPSKIDSVYEERKFDRLTNFPAYAILGAGEAERQRFAPYDGAEIHSSFINMLFAYGLPGLVLFLSIIATVLRRAPLYIWAGVAGPLIYSTTHNGLRATLFWVLLVICWHLYREGSIAASRQNLVFDRPLQ
ncbi:MULTISPECIES: hypothetical protein [Halomonadaceae]|jgi:hypothetical protein|uniref:Uncharacterized protein n=1 Tax=Vreelandella titanicae TaxID=664683 RepID=A0A653QXZ3_9GAMM|nr:MULTISPECIES: hypothetical protein [Halomonas]NAO96889.1 hypothetical protein [Halomonas sp. MG34]QGQ70369.1 hypothetical protein FDY98_10600 [Halomonas sp. PA16-9]UEQ06168.1 hypothetical protein LMS44_09935 [Halomonas profundus]KIN14897.1 hypothetical protein RO22_11970 [Halomonas sp. KHS3]MCD1587336.1 hypothetical protein [Halomonas sp. IOP_14]|tara:strand:- start:11793 stop:12938 length:1146 start_codon:yes stop_codon:yes gene_type:complete